MQKMMKLSDTRYIGVDNSEIKVGDIVAEKLLTGGYELFEIHTQNDIDKTTQKVITHSTQPLENINFVDEAEGNIIPKIKPLPLSEVKELLGVVDVEKKAVEWYNGESKYNSNYVADPYSWKEGYNQSLEDNKDKKYTEEDMRMAMDKMSVVSYSSEFGMSSNYKERKRYIDAYIKSHQPKAEWDVEFIDGKLKLI